MTRLQEQGLGTTIQERDRIAIVMVGGLVAIRLFALQTQASFYAWVGKPK